MIKDTYLVDENYPRKNIAYKYAIFDFSTSISALGKERHNVMISYFMEILLNTPKGIDTENSLVLCTEIRKLINSQPERSVINYCSWLNEKVICYGGLAKNPVAYKQELNRRLRVCLQDSYKNISNNKSTIDKMLLPGIKEHLHTLKNTGVKLYCVSEWKTEELKFVSDLLGLSEFFGENFFGVEYEHDFINTKGFTIDKIIRDNSIKPNSFIMYSNNSDDIDLCKSYGGYVFSVIIDNEAHECKTNEKSLFLSGVDMIINNYETMNM